MLFLADGLLEDRVREEGLVNVFSFQQPIALSKRGRFQDNSEERKGSRDYIKVSLVLKIASCFEILTITRYQPMFCD